MGNGAMNWKFDWLSKILPLFKGEIEHGTEMKKSYQDFARNLFILLLVLVLIPLISISILSHYQYKRLLQKNELTQLILNIEQAESTVEHFGSKLQSIIKFVGHTDRYEELTDPKRLEALFVRIQREYPDFVDIEIIDDDGKQKSYVGPYELESNGYTNETWYQEVVQRGIFISNVFSGHRQVPHFVIAISRNYSDRSGVWVLRVTIDGRTLQSYINTISTTSVDDVYLEDKEGIAQTQPRKFGSIGNLSSLGDSATTYYDIDQILGKNNNLIRKIIKITVNVTPEGEEVLRASMPLDNTPWNLVMIKKSYLYVDAWFFFQIKLFCIIASFVFGAILITLRLSKGITAHIRECDMKREHFLAEAENANKLASIGRLAAGVAHEINNPLSIINQKTGLVSDYFELTGNFDYKEDMFKALGGIQDSVIRCKVITHRLLGFARHTDIKTEELNINTVLEETVAFLSKEATYSQINIAFKLDETLYEIFSDRSQLQQVFLNIINNAIDAIGSNGTITLSAVNENKNSIKVQISDTGEGMSESVRKHIFDPFFTTKETGKGTGLGLSITYGIVEKLGGKINVLSELGQGSTFTIVLPVSYNGSMSDG